MTRMTPRLIVVAVAATFALTACGRDDNRATGANAPGSTSGTTGGTAASPTTPGSTPSPSGSGSAMSGGGAAPSGSTGSSASGGTSSPSGTSTGTPGGDTGAATSGTTPSAGTGSTGTTGPGTPGSGTTGSGTTGGTTGTGGSSSPTNPPGATTTPGKSSSLGTHIIGAHVQLAADTTTGTQASAKLASADKMFMQEAASGGLAEVEAGKIASRRAKHARVKQFGETLVKDHTQANEELRRIAADAGMTLPATPNAEHRAMLDKLTAEQGDDFDRMFVRTFGVKEHDKDIAAFQKQAEKGENPRLRAFAAKTLPKLKEHRAMAQRLESELGGN